jgi:hypothetical protein
MKNPPQQRLEAFSEILQGRHKHLGQSDMTFEPCADTAGLPIL